MWKKVKSLPLHGQPTTSLHSSQEKTGPRLRSINLPSPPGCRNAVVCGGRVESGSLVFANKNGGRQEGEGVGGGGESVKADAEASCLSPTPVSLEGPEDGVAWGMCVLKAFVVSGLRT